MKSSFCIVENYNLPSCELWSAVMYFKKNWASVAPCLPLCMKLDFIVTWIVQEDSVGGSEGWEIMIGWYSRSKKEGQYGGI